MNASDYEFIRALLKQRSGLMLAADKEYLIESRLMPVAQRHRIPDLGELAQRLRGDADGTLTADVVEAMTTNETFFFRDRIPFEQVRDFVLPSLMAARERTRRIRIWCAAASSGQEPYSLAMGIREMAPALKDYCIEILATDLSNDVLEKAKAGIYSQFEVQRGLPIQLLLKYFTQVGEMWQIAPQIRSMVQFRSLNLLSDFSRLGRFDLIVCRNVLIYFDQPTKTDVLDRLARTIAPDGFLILGAAETTVGLTQAFLTVPGRRGLYAPAEAVTLQPGLERESVASSLAS
ncbi:CheR family methyltransferase [Pseudorhodoplanes sp.]|uniref:CheR family methyltransferase n=1 Tax=Pseudorhodoplanes sp. TaxID=1934341 RepID=UPI00391D2C23